MTTVRNDASFEVSQASSLLSTPPASSSDRISKDEGGGQPTIDRRPPAYRPARDLPFELAQHAQTYFEEGLFTGGLNFLLSLSSASSNDASLPVFVAPRAVLALAATIAVHPVFTSRTVARDRWEQAHAALRLLRLSLTSVGPVGARLVDAFAFRKYGRGTVGDNYKDDDGDYVDDSSGGAPGQRAASGRGGGGGSEELKVRFAQGDSVWARPEDFWQVVGWAMNCSCLAEGYGERWKWWQPWLEFMVDALEADWELHYEAQTAEESIMWHYVELASGGYARSRRMMRAIFADGSQKSLNEFGEVFRNELKAPAEKQRGIKRTRDIQKVDVDKDVAPSTFVDLDELYGNFVEWIKPLRLGVFQQVMSASTAASRRVGMDAHTTLCELALQWMLESRAPSVRADRFLTRDKLVKQYLPFAGGAAEVAEQAKVAICLETLLRRAVEVGLVGVGDVEEVRRAVEEGVERRAGFARVVMAKEGKKKGRKRKKAKGERGEESEAGMEDKEADDEAMQEREAWLMLKEGEARMKAVVDMIPS
ncbi:hypothetical protein DV737_g4106, partial [Chaetothyriales sp. CBS 132003]